MIEFNALTDIQTKVLSRINEVKTQAWRFNKNKMISISKVLNQLAVEFDQQAGAEMASNNPYHEYYGKPVDEIIEIWNNKTDVAANTGISLDNYVQSIFDGCPIELDTITDEGLRRKCANFLNFHDNFLIPNNFQHIGCEVKIASPTLATYGRIDWLGVTVFNGKPVIVIFDWKQNEKISVEGFRGQTLKPPFNELQDSKLVRFTNQLHIYRYIIQQDCKIVVGGTLLAHITEKSWNVLKPAFQYNPNLVEKMVSFGRNQIPNYVYTSTYKK